jgi:hypothetical protein
MTDSGRTIRKMVVGLALAAAATAGFAACGSSSKTQTKTPAGQTQQTPAATTVPASPPTTKAPGNGGASF